MAITKTDRMRTIKDGMMRAKVSNALGPFGIVQTKVRDEGKPHTEQTIDEETRMKKN